VTAPADVRRCGVPRLADGKPCRWRVYDGDRCPAHQGIGEPVPECARLADKAHRIAAVTAARSPGGQTARQLVKILSAAASREDAWRAVEGTSDPARRRSLTRMLSACEARGTGDPASIVEDAWSSLRIALLLGETEGEAIAAEALAVLKARAKRITGDWARQLAEAEARGDRAEERAERAGELYTQHARRAEEKAA
jgi:hypothetical protein